jgi:hypothetical protein
MRNHKKLELISYNRKGDTIMPALAPSAHPARHLHSPAPTHRGGVRAVQVSYCAGQGTGVGYPDLH